MFRGILSEKRAKMVLQCVELYRYLAKDTGLWLPLHCQLFRDSLHHAQVMNVSRHSFRKRAKMVFSCVELYRYLAKDTGLWLPLHCQLFRDSVHHAQVMNVSRHSFRKCAKMVALFHPCIESFIDI